mmetsp:Transcript_31244/g.69513  ORF Transcript_31244/g.69513 Transcript_31244/m.69513 type:complete len:83 (-) Transcript_31244:627-875(-)
MRYCYIMRSSSHMCLSTSWRVYTSTSFGLSAVTQARDHSPGPKPGHKPLQHITASAGMVAAATVCMLATGQDVLGCTHAATH